MRVVATAGHVDHGKSSLVLALTGTDPDRFAEEKRRGLTIDLGFATTTLPSGAAIAFVDVPGHVRFLKNMLAGVGGVDACLFVVAATEGWKPQSEEHLRILELLGVTHGVVALTKVDLVDDERATLAELEVAERVAGTFLGDAAVVRVAAPAGEGLDALRAALDALVAATPAAADRDRPRLWIDRAFAAKGAGAVVTGTLTGGSLGVGDAVVVGPAARPARVRGIQNHGRSVERIGPGHRVALNLSGVDHADLARGDAVVRPGQWRPTARFDATLHVLAGVDHEVSRRGRVPRLRGLGRAPRAAPGARRRGGSPRAATGSCGCTWPRRSRSCPATATCCGRAGGTRRSAVARCSTWRRGLPAARARPDRSVDRVVAERGWIDADELEALTGERRRPDLGRWVAAPGAVAALIDAVVAQVAAAGTLGLDVAGLDERSRLALDAADGLVVDAGRVRLAGAGDTLAGHPFLAALEAGGCTPPAPDGVDRGELRELVRRGSVVECDGHFFAPSALDTAAWAAARLLARDGAGFTVGAFRDEVGATRKHAVPLLAELDRRGVTRRRGDLRIAGPRLPAR